MRAKRLDHRAVFVALAIISAPTVASAQFDGKAFRLPSGGASPGTRGVVQKPKPQVIVVQPSHHGGGYPHRTTVFPRRSSVVWVPAVVTADGRVFADFGYGFEQVHRSCAAATVMGGQPKVVAGNGYVLTPQTPTYTQPVPNQQTASQQLAVGNHAQTMVVAPAYRTCFSPHSSGGVVVYRF
jgi:hypothetical protein